MATENVGIDVEVRARLDRFDDQMRQAGRLVESTTKGMDRATQRLEKRFRRVEGEGQAYNRQLSAIERKIETVRRATEKGIVSNQRAAQTLDRLQRDYSNVARQASAAATTTGRVTAAAQKSIAAQSRLNGVYDRSITQLGQLAAQNRRVATDQQLVNTRLGAASRSLRTAGRSTSNFGMQAQNAAFQVGDFATQIASGQSATRALAQQLPQLLGGFGLFGAAVGAAVAVGGALIPVLTDIGDETKDANDATKNYADSLDAANKLIERLNNNGKTRIERLRQEAKEALKGARATVQANEARLEELRLQNEQDLFGAGRRQRTRREEAEAAEELAASQERLADLRERLNKALAEEEERLEDNTDATEDNTQAQRRALDTRQSVLAGLREQLELEQMTDRAAFQRTQVMKAQNRAMERGNLLREEQVRQIEETAGGLYDAREDLAA